MLDSVELWKASAVLGHRGTCDRITSPETGGESEFSAVLSS